MLSTRGRESQQTGLRVLVGRAGVVEVEVGTSWAFIDAVTGQKLSALSVAAISQTCRQISVAKFPVAKLPVAKLASRHLTFAQPPISWPRHPSPVTILKPRSPIPTLLQQLACFLATANHHRHCATRFFSRDRDQTPRRRPRCRLTVSPPHRPATSNPWPRALLVGGSLATDPRRHSNR